MLEGDRIWNPGGLLFEDLIYQAIVRVDSGAVIPFGKDLVALRFAEHSQAAHWLPRIRNNVLENTLQMFQYSADSCFLKTIAIIGDANSYCAARSYDESQGIICCF